MSTKQLVRKLHLVVFSSGDFAMVEGESGEEVLSRYVPCHATAPYHATPLTRSRSTSLARHCCHATAPYQVYFLSRGIVAIVAGERQVAT